MEGKLDVHSDNEGEDRTTAIRTPVKLGPSTSVVFIEAKALARSRVTLTYSLSVSYTDVGFGCMLRSLQMLLAHSLRLACVEEDNDAWLQLFSGDAFDKVAEMLRSKPGYAEMIGHFSDADGGMFSLPQLVKNGMKFGIHSWSWYSPRLACLIAAEIMNSRDDGDLIIHVVTDRIVFQLEIETLFKGRGHGVLLLIPARLGTEQIEHHLKAQLIKWLRDPHCVGLIGGPGSRGLYSFATTEDDTILYLDPHTTIRVGDVGDSSYDDCIRHCHSADNLGEMTVDELNPECALGFLFRNKEVFRRWAMANRVDALVESSRSEMVITVLPGFPSKLDLRSRSPSDEGAEGEDEEDGWKVL